MPEVTCGVFGGEGVGKSCLSFSLSTMYFEDPPVGENARHAVTLKVDGEHYIIRFMESTHPIVMDVPPVLLCV